MDQGWEEVDSGEQVVQALGLAHAGAPSLERLLLAPGSDRYLRVEADEDTSNSGEFRVHVPRTRFFFNLTACKELKGDAVVALTAYLITHSAPVAATVAALRKLNDNLVHLSYDEMALVRTILTACAGNPYKIPVPEATLRQLYVGDPDTLDGLLDALQSKGVIKARRGGQVQLIY
jgi:hypothetical protein